MNDRLPHDVVFDNRATGRALLVPAPIVPRAGGFGWIGAAFREASGPDDSARAGRAVADDALDATPAPLGDEPADPDADDAPDDPTFEAVPVDRFGAVDADEAPGEVPDPGEPDPDEPVVTAVVGAVVGTGEDGGVGVELAGEVVAGVGGVVAEVVAVDAIILDKCLPGCSSNFPAFLPACTIIVFYHVLFPGNTRHLS